MSCALWLSSMTFGAHGLANAEQFVGLDCHFLHLKGVVVFHKSVLLLWSNNFMVMSPHVLVTVIDPLQLASVQMLSLLSLQDTLTLLWYFLWTVSVDTSSVSEHVMQSPEAVSKSESATSSLDESESDQAWSGSATPLVGLEDGLAGFCPHCWLLGPASGTDFGMIPSPHVELYSLLTSTSGEQIWVLLL